MPCTVTGSATYRRQLVQSLSNLFEIELLGLQLLINLVSAGRKQASKTLDGVGDEHARQLLQLRPVCAICA